MLVAETKARIAGKLDRVVKVGSTLRLTCRVFLGRSGPDEDYKQTAVVHWFQDSRLLDPDLENWLSHQKGSKAGGLDGGRSPPKLATGMEVTEKGIRGWLEVRRVTPYDAGNYSCVPSYAIPDWTQVHIMHGSFVFSLPTMNPPPTRLVFPALFRNTIQAFLPDFVLQKFVRPARYFRFYRCIRLHI